VPAPAVEPTDIAPGVSLRYRIEWMAPTIFGMPGLKRSPLRPAVAGAPFDLIEDKLRPFIEDAEVRERRRKESAAELLQEYEANHGEISEDELHSLDSEWLH
jgi:hypothetical protein